MDKKRYDDVMRGLKNSLKEAQKSPEHARAMLRRIGVLDNDNQLALPYARPSSGRK